MIDDELWEAMARTSATSEQSEQMEAAAERLNQAAVQLGLALGEACAAIAYAFAAVAAAAATAAVNEVWPAVKELVQELVQELAEAAEKEEAKRDEADSRHDGAVTDWIVWLRPPKTMEELYGQGVDRGPGPRPVLIRTADDGPWRAETGKNRKETAMLIAMNIVLVVIAAILFLGVVGEKDKDKNRNLTQAFVATMAAIILVNICMWAR